MRKFLALALISMSSLVIADDRFKDVEVSATAVAGSVYMLKGAGGNIGVSAGADGLLLVDDQYAPLADKISKTLAGISEQTPKYVINTHYHGDHTGSNAFFRENKGATIFAHENVRIRLASGEDVNSAALPVVTYQDGIKFHLNGDTIHVIHLAEGHTDGDSIVWFEKANVLHTGDLFFKDMFPYIDLGAGGDVQGYIESVEILLAKIDDDTEVIPGHGAMAKKEDLQRFVDMIKETYAFVQNKKSQGASEKEVIKDGLDDKWQSWSWAFINEERWIKTLYQ